ncbi:basic proline-rich protein-like [Budorcas taxicolor]|uniref:basic proline-rich protein-like n=1 Tax=Budorcas taxicolor TaxID=37181 RepID=UPI0022841AFC|nr:basic proline-rich protein-like [Budorcas taxicolor]
MWTQSLLAEISIRLDDLHSFFYHNDNIFNSISHVAQEGRPRTARKPNVQLGSYVLPSPAPASAAAFLTDIGGREPPRALPRRPAPSARGGPLRPGSLRLTPPRRPAGRAPRPRRLRRPDDPARRAWAAWRPERRNRCPAPLAEPPGSRADSTSPAALNGAFRRKGEAGEGGRREGRRQDKTSPAPAPARRPGLDWGGGPGAAPPLTDAPGPAPRRRRCNPIPPGRPPPPDAAVAAARATVSANQPWTAPRSASFRALPFSRPPPPGRPAAPTRPCLRPRRAYRPSWARRGDDPRRRSFTDYFSLLQEFRGRGG